MSYAEELRSNYAEIRKRLGLSNVQRQKPRPVPQTKPFISPPLSQKIAERRVHKYERIEAAFRTFRREPMPVERIVREVAEAHGVTPALIRGPQRDRHIVAARHEAMYRAFQETKMSLTSIGRLLCKDHTTVIHGIRAHQARLGGTRYIRPDQRKAVLE